MPSPKEVISQNLQASIATLDQQLDSTPPGRLATLRRRMRERLLGELAQLLLTQEPQVTQVPEPAPEPPKSQPAKKSKSPKPKK